MKSPVDRYVTRLLDGRRPKPFAASEDDTAQIRTAIGLMSHRTELARPSDAFVARLRKELAAEQSRKPDPPVASAAMRHRRRFVRTGLIGAAAFGAGLIAEPLIPQGDGAGTVQARTEDEVRPYRGAWHPVAVSAQLAEGAVMDFDLGALSGYLHRSSGRIRAVSGMCTHQACRLDLNSARSMLVCPCHGATFTLAGAPQPSDGYRSPGSLPALPRIPVRERLGHIEVYAPAPAPAPKATSET